MQKIKRIVKKIGAISTGAVFLGATMMGAMAADLSEYPNPFVMNGAANNAVIIHSGNGMDTTAAGYILTGLSGAVTSTGGAAVTDVEGGYKLEYSGDRFNLGEDGYNVDSKLTKTQLPVMLIKGKYNDDEGTNQQEIEYAQELQFINGSSTEKTIWYIYDQNKEDNDRETGDYLYLSKTGETYTYVYDFNLDSAVTVANAADLQSTKLNLLGRDFTISSIGFTTGNVTKLTLLAGDVTQVVATGDTISGVKLVSVDSNGAACTIEYQGELSTINDGSTKTMSDGTIIGVTKVTPSNKQATPDYCELNIGADKVEIETGKEVKVNGEKVLGSKVTFSGVNFDQFNVTYKPDSRMYMKVGDEFKDPVFGAFKLIFGGIVEDSLEDINIVATGDKVDITAINKEGDTTTWTAYVANTTGRANIVPGSFYDEPFITNDGDFVTNTSIAAGELKDMTGIRFLYSKNERSHIIKITSIDTVNNETDFLDETTGTSYDNQKFTAGGAGQTYTFLSPGFTLNFSDRNARVGNRTAGSGGDGDSGSVIDFVDIHDDYGPSFFTKNGGNLTFYSRWSYSMYNHTLVNRGSGEGIYPIGPNGQYLINPYVITFGESDTGAESDIKWPPSSSGVHNSIRLLNFTYDSTNQEINLQAATADRNFVHLATTLLQKSRSETTIKTAKTLYGTYVEQVTPTSSGTDSIMIKYPDTASYANVWVAPTSAIVSTSDTEVATGINLMTETEVSDVSAYNAIVVGGPAANEIAANLLGLTYPAVAEASGLSEGEAILKMVDNGANVALLAFGWEKDDTARAAKVLQDYDNFALSGEEASITGTTANPTIAE